MCIRDRVDTEQSYRGSGVDARGGLHEQPELHGEQHHTGSGCLLYTSDAADERSSVDLGGRRIIKKKNNDCIKRSRTQ